MTGYLQRLAASVRPRASRIRPAVKPLFARGATSEAVEQPPLEDEDRVVAARSDAPAARAVEGEGARLAARTPRAREAPDFEAAAPHFQAAAPIERLVAEQTRTPPEPRRALATSSLAAREQADEVVETARPFETATETVAAERIEVRTAQAPLDEPRATRREDDAPRGEPTRRREVAGSAARANEIHINIGRVEVIAAPPSEPRAAPRASKAVSLEDYLSGVSARRR